MAKSILVVCVGNICRSPMAEVMLANELPEDYEVSSAGIAALVGEEAHPRSMDLMRERGLSLESHIARQLDDDLLRQSDLVFTMEKGHSDWIEERWPHARGRVYRWGHWDDFDVPDPYRRGDEVFRRALALIDKGLEAWKKRLSLLI